MNDLGLALLKFLAMMLGVVGLFVLVIAVVLEGVRKWMR